jgi:hypothetical protein
MTKHLHGRLLLLATGCPFGLPFGVSANTLADGQHTSMAASVTTVNDARAFGIVVARLP